MHKWLAAVIIMLLAYPALAEAQGRGGGRGGRGAGGGAGPAAPTGPVAGHGVDVPGYWARRDNPEELKQGLKFAPSNGGIRATTGPAAIFWHPSHEASGKYTVSARFTVPKVPATQEAFGLFVGGQNLSDDDQRYVHFLNRPDVKYSNRRRAGVRPSNVGGEWADHAAVVRPDPTGRMSNELSVQVAGNTAVFRANGQEVARHKLGADEASGIAGLRINHGVDVQIDGFAVTQ
jgi:hypothetical protein